MNKDKRNNIQLLGTLNNADESGIIANANQIYDANEDKSTQDVSKEHADRIKNLEAKEDAMQTTLENISKTGEASAASNVTYNHNDSQLDATNVQQAIDEVRKKSNYNDGENIIDFNTIHLITDNPEYICVAVDADEKILYGIKTDGQPYFGVGCPQQVKDYIDEQINKILGTNDITTTIDSLKEIEAFLKDFTNSDTLKKLLDLKANVDEVRTTTDDIYKKSNPNDSEGNVIDTNTIISFEDNPEYIKVITDNVGKLIEAIGLDGIRKFFAGINIQGTLQCITDNPEYIAVWLDNQKKIIFGFKTDGDVYIGYGVPSQIKEYISIISTDVQVKLDSITQDLANTKEDIDKKINFGDNTYPSNVHEVSDNPEFVSANTDNDGKILSYRDKNGVLHENAGIEAKILILSDRNAEEIASKLKSNDYLFDWSDYLTKNGDEPLNLPMPKCAKMNIIGITSMPVTKTANLHAEVQFWDMQGNYFKKKVILNANGQNSIYHWAKKNATIDFLDNDFDGDTFAIRFGNWVAQDSFHLKSYMYDSFKGRGCVFYKLYEEFMSTRDITDNRPYKKYISDSLSKMNDWDNRDIEQVYETGARCFPDGFPCILYLNNKFYGIFSFQLKKHRDNYYMNKKNAKNIHIEGGISYERFFNGTIDWSGGDYGIEVRNPKNLYYQNSSSNKAEKYDFDGGHIVNNKNDQEPMGTDSAYYDAKNKDMVRCAEAKNYIITFSKYISELKELETQYTNKSIELNDLKSEIEKRFNVSFMIDYILFQLTIGNGDSIHNNCQWTTWDGVQWCPNPYDLDSSLGNTSKLGDDINYPFGWCWKYYLPEMSERYKTLKNKGIINANHIAAMLSDWSLRIGLNYYKLECNKWNDGSLGTEINDEYWKETDGNDSINDYNASKQYAIGDTVKVTLNNIAKYFSCIKACTNISPIKTNNQSKTIYSVEEFVNGQIERMDKWFTI